MARNMHLPGLLVLLVAGLAPGIRDSLGAQDPGPGPPELKEVFKLFQIQFNRSYSNPAEYAHRLDIFGHNLAKAQRLQEEDLGTAEFGVTPFSDLTEEEFGQLYGNWRAARKGLEMVREVSFERQKEWTPQSCDWRKAHVISPVKNQGQCRCCWAMAAAGNIEALWNINFKPSVEVSVQELLDCGRCGDGCIGGYVWDAFITALNYSGLASEKDYPFRGRANTHRCLAPNYTKVAWIYDYIMLPRNEQAIAEYVATQGPITVIINSERLQHYKKGVIKGTPSTCDPWATSGCTEGATPVASPSTQSQPVYKIQGRSQSPALPEPLPHTSCLLTARLEGSACCPTFLHTVLNKSKQGFCCLSEVSWSLEMVGGESIDGISDQPSPFRMGWSAPYLRARTPWHAGTHVHTTHVPACSSPWSKAWCPNAWQLYCHNEQGGGRGLVMIEA
ncbi:PREDICTED: cathepsin W isoform X1 [Chinchilla lanigera]|uniref:cathepsin W isoform X1 n=1 Tax=Chinchilla lanigera TaxID=34839 RepID=UPI00038F0606|nr:PREDICTED: cathepsin W isoform X1 [Chinchilla lanigera]